MTDDEVRQLIREECKRVGIAGFARRAGVTRSHIYGVLNGNRLPRGLVLDAVGVEAVVIYRRKETTNV